MSLCQERVHLFPHQLACLPLLNVPKAEDSGISSGWWPLSEIKACSSASFCNNLRQKNACTNKSFEEMGLLPPPPLFFPPLCQATRPYTFLSNSSRTENRFLCSLPIHSTVVYRSVHCVWRRPLSQRRFSSRQLRPPCKCVAYHLPEYPLCKLNQCYPHRAVQAGSQHSGSHFINETFR